MSAIEVNQDIIGSFLKSIETMSEVFGKQARKDLEANGIQMSDDDEWYDAATFADVMRRWAEERSEHAIQNAGEQMADDLSDQFPDDSDVVTALNLMGDVHEQVHRGDGYVGGYRVEPTEDRSATVTAQYGGNQFPEPIARGAILGVVKNAGGYAATIELEDSDVDEDRATYEYTVDW